MLLIASPIERKVVYKNVNICTMCPISLKARDCHFYPVQHLHVPGFFFFLKTSLPSPNAERTRSVASFLTQNVFRVPCQPSCWLTTDPLSRDHISIKNHSKPLSRSIWPHKFTFRRFVYDVVCVCDAVCVYNADYHFLVPLS